MMDDPADIAKVIREELKHWLEIELSEVQWQTVLRALDAMPSKPRTVAISRCEGGEWVEFVPHVRPETRLGHQVHAIKFEDGSVWDAYNGWRTERDSERSYSHWGIHGSRTVIL